MPEDFDSTDVPAAIARNTQDGAGEIPESDGDYQEGNQ